MPGPPGLERGGQGDRVLAGQLERLAGSLDGIAAKLLEVVVASATAP